MRNTLRGFSTPPLVGCITCVKRGLENFEFTVSLQTNLYQVEILARDPFGLYSFDNYYSNSSLAILVLRFCFLINVRRFQNRGGIYPVHSSNSSELKYLSFSNTSRLDEFCDHTGRHKRKQIVDNRVTQNSKPHRCGGGAFSFAITPKYSILPPQWPHPSTPTTSLPSKSSPFPTCGKWRP